MEQIGDSLCPPALNAQSMRTGAWAWDGGQAGQSQWKLCQYRPELRERPQRARGVHSGWCWDVQVTVRVGGFQYHWCFDFRMGGVL